MTSEVQAQARALGDPTRHAIFSYLAAAGRPVDVAELTRHLGRNHNGIRQHLARLVTAGLVDEATAPSSGRGRPRLIYTVSPLAGSRWGVVGPYERLTVLLAAALRTGATPVEIGRKAVSDSVDPPAGDEDPVDVVVRTMARHGFNPVAHRCGDQTEVVLRSCPFETAALADPETICAIHLGMAEGVTELTGGELTVDELVRRDPRAAHCRLRLHRQAPATDRGAA